MAHPYYVIESALQHYLTVWNCGLRPHLSVNTNENGTIAVNLTVTFMPVQHQNLISNPYSSHRKRRRSGQAARRRRQQGRTIEANICNEIAVQDESADQNESDCVSNSEEENATVVTDPSTESEAFPCDQNAEFTTSQVPINCIMYEEGCTNMISKYFNNYTAICEPCSAYMNMKLKATPFPHHLCPCCHEASEGPPLSLCKECLREIDVDGYAESQWGSFHLDRTSGKIACINLYYD